ncbi:MAG: glycosyltransferase family 9 protein [Kineosporiaceae bacterium]
MTLPDPATTPSTRVPGVRRIAVLRANALGDFVLTLPALQALRRAYPSATITLLGTPMHVALLRGRPGPWDEVVAVPGAPGVLGGADAPDPAALEAFVAEHAARGYDLAVQLHGGGGYSNPFLRRLGARVTLGNHDTGVTPLDRGLPYPHWHHEVLRMLELMALVGADGHEPASAVLDLTEATALPDLALVGAAARPLPTPPLGGAPGGSGAAGTASTARTAPDGVDAVGWTVPRLAVTAVDRAAAADLLAPLLADAHPGTPLVVLHPGASDPRRHWPAASYAQLARRLVTEDGARIAVVGSGPRESAAAAEVAAADPSVLDLSGRLDLPALVGVLAAADLVVANDSGPRHLAGAVGTPTVGIFWCGNLLTAAPLDRSRHAVAVSFRTHCPACGLPQGSQRCEHDESFVADVTVDEVRDLAERFLAGAATRR